VKIKNSKLIPYSLPLKEQWISHSHSLNVRQGYLLQIEDNLGHIGYGDCAPLPIHGTETATEALEALESLPPLSGILVSDALNELPKAGSSPAARCAVETALLDLTTKQLGTPLHRWLNPESAPGVKINATVGMLDEGLTDRVTTAITQGYSLLKLKVGISEPQHELKLLNQLCSNLADSILLRLDANRSWDIATANNFLKEITQMPIESLEEPLAQPDITELKQLQDGTDITLALDETVAELNADAISQLKPLRRITLKPMVLGGVIPALRLGQLAHELGIETVVTTTIDSAAGVWAATHLAAALDPDSKLCHGLATSEWIQQDLGKGPNINNGGITIPQTAGLGFVPFD
jgi:o-succinylbenzoate synthase